MSVDDKTKKLTYEQAIKKLPVTLPCGKVAIYLTCFNCHHVQGDFSQGRGYINNNGRWVCSTNDVSGCPQRERLNDSKLKELLESKNNASKSIELSIILSAIMNKKAFLE